MIYKLYPGLTGSVTIIWTTGHSQLPGTVYNLFSVDDNIAVLHIDPLRTSYPTSYTCLGSYFSPADNITRTEEQSISIIINSEWQKIWKYFFFSCQGIVIFWWWFST